jgi:hypothetical protein
MVIQEMIRNQLAESGWLRLALCASIVAGIWLIVLPRLSSIDIVAKHIEHLEEREVHAGAMYYTDLEKLPTRPAWIEDEIVLW